MLGTWKKDLRQLESLEIQFLRSVKGYSRSDIIGNKNNILGINIQSITQHVKMYKDRWKII